MTKPLEVLERGLIRQPPLLIERAMIESGDDDGAIIRNVRRIVIGTARAGSEAVEFIAASRPWAMFRLLYPSEGDSILADARRGIGDAELG